jgi:putative ABC transport system substrate-binding protein
MKRREFIAGLGGAAAWPVVGRAQQPAVPVIGFLSSGSSGPFARNLTAFRQGINERGYVEGQNVVVEYRWAEGRFDRLPMLAAELVQRNVAVIFASGGPLSALAAKAATTTIPVVFIFASDPIKLGFVASLNHPGGNATGVSLFAVAVEPKKLEILHELVPKAGKIGVLVNPRNAESVPELQTAAGALGLQIYIVNVTTGAEFGAAFTTLVQQEAGALVVAADAVRPSHNIRVAGIRRGWWPDELWNRTNGRVSSSWRLHGPHSPRRKTGRSPSGAANQV